MPPPSSSATTSSQNSSCQIRLDHQQPTIPTLRISNPSSYGICNGGLATSTSSISSITNSTNSSNSVSSLLVSNNCGGGLVNSLSSSQGSSSQQSSQSASSIIFSQQQPTFDPYDEDSWFFGPMSRADATELLLKNNDIGAFLVRESTSVKLDLVLTVKDGDEKVSHYIINRFIPDNNQQQVCFKIGEQNFPNLPSLLAYYKVNNLDDTSLKVTAQSKDSKVLPRKSFTKDYIAEVLKDNRMRISPKFDNFQRILATGPALTQRRLPCLAKVLQDRIPNAYDKTALTLKEGDIVTVTKTDIGGCWEGEVAGRQGHFPFNYVEFIEEMNK